MYNDFFQLRLNPFSQNHLLNSVFLPSSHRLVLEQLSEEANKSTGIFLLLGSIGVGKSSLITALIEKHKQNNTKTVFKHLNPSSSLQFSASEPSYMAMIMKNFAVNCSLNTDSQIKNIFILDNANHFSTPFLSKLLSKVAEQNQKNKSTLLILTGQPKLQLQIKNLTLGKNLPSLLIKPFDESETTDYINNRLFCSDCPKNIIFNDQAIHYIAKLSKGIPWAINTICSVSLFQAGLDKQSIISKEIVESSTEFCYLENQHTNNTIKLSAKEKSTPLQVTTNCKARRKPLNKSNTSNKQLTKNIFNTAA